ncbi:hypothetical protein LTR16_003224 [Cryomyces antarcticus]|uniref:YjeF C-terminal domain-containing protein n=1 Tax=Cryomyces antarcticus TaxID=329879 RepID=A0ABR0LY27_9PEZI|nr:hypothetical protein LTR16_003224 [Cryomyces antarcticus]
MAAVASRKEILGKVYKMIPPMLEKFHKDSVRRGLLDRPYHLRSKLASSDHIVRVNRGETRADLRSPGMLGRVAVIGGSEDYTGAPYFSAMASAKLGADMARIKLFQLPLPPWPCKAQL